MLLDTRFYVVFYFQGFRVDSQSAPDEIWQIYEINNIHWINEIKPTEISRFFC